MAGSSRRSPVVQWLPPTVAALLIHGATLSLALRQSPSETPSVVGYAEPMWAELENTHAALENAPSNTETPSATSREVASPKVATSNKSRSTPVHPPAPPRAAAPAPLEQVRSAPANNASSSEVGTAIATLPATLASAPAAVPSAEDGGTGSGLARTADLLASDGRGLQSANQPLSTKPRLISSGAACQGVLGGALDEPTKVTLVLQVGTDGTASPTAVRSVAGQPVPELKAAAQRCAQRLRFLPARSASGQLVVASSIVKLTFSNHPSPRLPGLHAGGTRRRQGAI